MHSGAVDKKHVMSLFMAECQDTKDCVGFFRPLLPPLKDIPKVASIAIEAQENGGKFGNPEFLDRWTLAGQVALAYKQVCCWAVVELKPK